MKAWQKAALAVAIVLVFLIPALAQTNTITTTAPVTSETTISVGTLAGQVLTWIAAVFSVPLGTLAAAWLYRLFALAGVQTTEVMRQRLQEMIVNGLNVGARKAENELRGRGQIEIKNKAVAETVQYVQKHGADTLKYLGVDPASNKAVEAIKARIETAIADAATPTPAVLTPPPPVPVPAPPDRPGVTR